MLRAFKDLVARVGENPSWRAVANIVNSIHLVNVVSRDYHQRHTRVDSVYLQSKMQEFLENFLELFISSEISKTFTVKALHKRLQPEMNIFKNEKFKDFITETGGWDDFLDYYDHVSKNQTDKPSPGFLEAILPAAAVAGIGMLVFNSFR